MSRPGRLAAVWACALALAPPAWAEGEGQRLEGNGRITVAPGWRLTPNDFFSATAAAAANPVVSANRGGPSFAAAFGYSATDLIEVAIDVFASGERLTLGQTGSLSSITYGAQVGPRFQFGDWIEGLVPYVGAALGPTLIYETGDGLGPPSETLTTGYAGCAGATFRLTDRVGLTLEYRFLFARGAVPGLGGINGGGHTFSLGLTVYLPTAPSPDPMRR